MHNGLASAPCVRCTISTQHKATPTRGTTAIQRPTDPFARTSRGSHERVPPTTPSHVFTLGQVPQLHAPCGGLTERLAVFGSLPDSACAHSKADLCCSCSAPWRASPTRQPNSERLAAYQGGHDHTSHSLCAAASTMPHSTRHSAPTFARFKPLA